MERAVFDRMSAQEEVHWWFAARRDVLSAVMRRLVHVPAGARILEAGCGTGGNLDMLSGLGQVRAFELDADARQAATAKSGLSVAEGSLPDAIPFGTEEFDVIGLFDVLEHVEADSDALRALGARLAPGGRIVLTVPALPWMWSRHDEQHHHFRRYTKRHLRRLAAEVGLEIDHLFYFNTLLFPVAVAMRAVKSLIGSQTADDSLPPPWMNAALRGVFASERHLVGRVSFPVGLSLCAVLLAPDKP